MDCEAHCAGGQWGQSAPGAGGVLLDGCSWPISWWCAPAADGSGSQWLLEETGAAEDEKSASTAIVPRIDLARCPGVMGEAYSVGELCQKPETA